MPGFAQRQKRLEGSHLVSSARAELTRPRFAPVHAPLAQQQFLGNQGMRRFAQSCPLALPSPTICPFGGVCHTCPRRIQTKLAVGKSRDKYEQEADIVAKKVIPISYHETKDGASGKSSCSPTWYGDTGPEVDGEGNFTGKVIVNYNDAELRDPCVRECVQTHENVHVMQLTPVVNKIYACDVAAGGDWEEKGKCNEMANRELNEPLNKWECEAYQQSYTCLTLKILDPESPCSKSPHREAIQRHRGYEACEMKRYCTEAKIPGAGIPRV